MAVSGGGGGGKGGAIRAGRAFVEISADDTALKSGLARAKQMVLGFASGLAKGGGLLAGLGTAVLAPIAESFREVVKYFDEFTKASDRTGATTEALSALAYAAEQSDASLADVTSGTKFLQRNLSAAAAGSKEAQDALKRLGLTADDLKGKSLEEQFDLIADGLAGIEDPADRTAAAIGVLGRGGLALVPMLKDGAAGLQALRKEAGDVGAVIGGEDARNATKIGDSISRSWTAVKNTFRAVGAALLPQADAIEQWSGVLVQAVKVVRDFINENRGLVLGVVAGAAAVAAAGGVLLGLAAAITAATFVVGALGTAVGAVGAVLAVVFSPVGLGVAALLAAGAAVVYVAHEVGLLGEIARWFGRVWGDLSATFSATWQGIREALAAGRLDLALKVAGAGLKVVWETLIAELKILWNGFLDFVKDTAVVVGNAAVNALRKALREAKENPFGVGGLAGIAFEAGAGAPGALAARQAEKAPERAARDAEIRAGVDAAKAELDAAILDAKSALAFRAGAVLALIGLGLGRGRGAGPAAATAELAGVRGQFGGGALASALGVGEQTVEKKQLAELEEQNKHLAAIEDKVGGVRVE